MTTGTLERYLDADVTDGPAAQDDFFKDFDTLVPEGDYEFVRKPADIDHEADADDEARYDESIASIIAPDAVPQIEPPGDDEVRLPGGLVLSDGSVRKDALVRELTGEDEEALAKAAGNLLRFTRTLLSAVVEVGGEPATKEIIRDLLVGDREALILGIRRATFGNEVTFEQFTCPGCGDQLDITVDLSTLDTKELENPEKREFEVSLRKGAAIVRLATGADQEAVMDMGVATGAEENTLLLSRCVLSINGKKVNTREQVKQLGLADRKALIAFLAEQQPGPRYDEVKSKHEDCETEFPIYLAVDDLFRGF